MSRKLTKWSKTTFVACPIGTVGIRIDGQTTLCPPTFVTRASAVFALRYAEDSEIECVYKDGSIRDGSIREAEQWK